MQELTVQSNINLPANIGDLSKFVLIGREKLTAVKAEIRAIDKLGIAEEVRLQKQEETQMLAEALLDAEARIGELLKQLPKAVNNNKQGRNQHTGGQSSTAATLTSGAEQTEQDERTKADVIKGLGFSKTQANRFETLAENKDLIEQVKTEARANDELPTRSRVLELAQERKKSGDASVNEQRRHAECDSGDQEYYRHVDRVTKVSLTFIEALAKINCIHVEDQELLELWLEGLPDYNSSIDRELKNISDARRQLDALEAFLQSKKKLRLVSHYEQTTDK